MSFLTNAVIKNTEEQRLTYLDEFNRQLSKYIRDPITLEELVQPLDSMVMDEALVDAVVHNIIDPLWSKLHRESLRKFYDADIFFGLDPAIVSLIEKNLSAVNYAKSFLYCKDDSQNRLWAVNDLMAMVLLNGDYTLPTMFVRENNRREIFEEIRVNFINSLCCPGAYPIEYKYLLKRANTLLKLAATYVANHAGNTADSGKFPQVITAYNWLLVPNFSENEDAQDPVRELIVNYLKFTKLLYIQNIPKGALEYDKWEQVTNGVLPATNNEVQWMRLGLMYELHPGSIMGHRTFRRYGYDLYRLSTVLMPFFIKQARFKKCPATLQKGSHIFLKSALLKNLSSNIAELRKMFGLQAGCDSMLLDIKEDVSVSGLPEKIIVLKLTQSGDLIIKLPVLFAEEFGLDCILIPIFPFTTNYLISLCGFDQDGVRTRANDYLKNWAHLEYLKDLRKEENQFFLRDLLLFKLTRQLTQFKSLTTQYHLCLPAMVDINEYAGGEITNNELNKFVRFYLKPIK